MKKPRVWRVTLLSLLIFSVSAAWVGAEATEGKWPGVDETVVEKYAKDQGREARTPLLDTDQGDLLLFLFLLAGAVGGFVAGYYWRVLINEKPLKMNKDPQRLT
ncbi:MAG: cobalt ABC transporter permease [Desulfobacterota bacterium]|jgi:cobalt/nickel transport system permease protein|nr:cobalt ABC transporter permease [Thermodesulfobacteriota bacterium]